VVISRRVEASIGFENDSVVLVVEDSLEFFKDHSADIPLRFRRCKRAIGRAREHRHWMLDQETADLQPCNSANRGSDAATQTLALKPRQGMPVRPQKMFAFYERPVQD